MEERAIFPCVSSDHIYYWGCPSHPGIRPMRSATPPLKKGREVSKERDKDQCPLPVISISERQVLVIMSDLFII
jgi:hypothetical protein